MTVHSAPRVLVAGVGNLFLSDDGFGPEVARRLGTRALPEGVRVADYGIRSLHLAYDLLDGCDWLVLIDVVAPRGAPGSVHVIEVDPASVSAGAPDPHGLAPHHVLAAVAGLGGRLPPTVLVGCEPADMADGIGLSEPVEAAVEPAVEAVLALVGVSATAGGR